RSQHFYACTIRKYYPALLHAPTDHGYAPGDLLSPLALFKIGAHLLFWTQKKRRTAYREFKTEEWTDTFYQQSLFGRKADPELFSLHLENDYRSGIWKAKRLDFAKAASFKLWLEMPGVW